MLVGTQIFSSLGIGLLVGVLLGLSSAPVVGLVVGSITALLASLLGFRLPNRDDNASSSENLPEAMRQMLIGLRAGTFGFACIVGILAGIYMRTHDTLSPPEKGLEARYTELISIGFDPKDARRLLISPSGQITPSTGSTPDTQNTILFSTDAETCAQLEADRFANLAAAASYYRGLELDWLANLTRDLDAGLSDDAEKRLALTAVISTLCRPE